MNALRLWLACIWLVFAAVAPAHSAGMTTSICDHMIMPHAPAHHAPVPGNETMPCCQAPDLLPAGTLSILPARKVSRVMPRPTTEAAPAGVIPLSDPRPPKNCEA